MRQSIPPVEPSGPERRTLHAPLLAWIRERRAAEAAAGDAPVPDEATLLPATALRWLAAVLQVECGEGIGARIARPLDQHPPAPAAGSEQRNDGSTADGPVPAPPPVP